MVEKCKYCGKDINELSSAKKGNHVSNCDKNPNYKLNIDKRNLTRSKNKRLKNPIINLNLKCLNCGKDFEIDVIESYYKKDKYKKCCCENCAKTYSSTKLDRKKTKEIICKNCGENIIVNILSSKDTCCEKCRIIKRDNTKKIKIENKTNKKIVCKFCGDEICKRPKVCRKLRQKNNIFQKYFKFDMSKCGSSEFYIEFDSIVEKLKTDYFDNELSFSEIGKKYDMNFQTIHMVFKSLNIQSRTFSDAINIVIKKGRNTQDSFYSYKNGHHITWKGDSVHYRSSYEKEYYCILDDKKIEYTVESLRLQYYDTQKQKNRIAIPDIYIKNINEIIEIKSKWTLDEINMLDKIKAYKKLGYNVRVVIGEGNRNFFKNANERIY